MGDKSGAAATSQPHFASFEVATTSNDEELPSAAAAALPPQIPSSDSWPDLRLAGFSQSGFFGDTASLLSAPRLGTVNDIQAGVALFKALVGPGLLFLPAGVRQAGLVPAALVTALVGIGSLWCMILLLRAAAHLRSQGIKASSLGDIGMAALGRTGKLLIEISVIGTQLGTCTAYCIFVANTLRAVLYESAGGYPAKKLEQPCPLPDWLLSESLVHIVIVCAILPLTPLTWIRQLKYFAITNTCAAVMLLLSLVFMLVAFIVGVAKNGPSDSVKAFDATGSLIYVGVAMYAFEGIGVLIPVEQSMANPDHCVAVTTVVMISVTIIEIVFSCAAYTVFGEETNSIITSAFAEGKLLGGVGAAWTILVAWVLIVLFTYPLQFFPAARIIEGYMFRDRSSGWKWTKNAIRSGVVCSTIIIAEVGFDQIDNLVAIIGAVCCVPLGLVFPALFHYKICLSQGGSPPRQRRRRRGTFGDGAPAVAEGAAHTEAAEDSDSPQGGLSMVCSRCIDLLIILLGSSGVLLSLCVAIYNWVMHEPEKTVCTLREA